MPTEIMPEQSLTRLPNGLMRIDGFDVTLDSLNILVGQNTQHRIHIDSYIIQLDSGHVHIYVIKRSSHEK